MGTMEYINLSEILKYIKAIWVFSLLKWKQLVLLGLLGSAIGLLVAFQSKAKYNATLSFILNENEGGPSFNLSSLAGLAGLQGISGGGSVNEDKLQFIAQSRKILGTTLLEESVIYGEKELLANHFLKIYEMDNGFGSDTTLLNFVKFEHTKLQQLSYAENKVLDKIISIMLKNGMYYVDAKKKAGIVSQNAGILSLNLNSTNEEFSKSFVEKVYQNLVSFYTLKTTQRQLRNFELIKQRADSLKGILYEKESYGASYFDRNLGLVRMQGRVELERTKRDVEMLGLMYAEVLKNQEIARFALDNQTPVFQVIDEPTLPLEKKKLSKLISMIVGGIVLGFMGFLYFTTKQFQEIKLYVQKSLS